MRLAICAIVTVLASGCREAPPARPLAARVTDIAEVNTTLRFWRPGADSSPWTEMASLPLGSHCLGLRFDGLGTRLAVLCAREVLIVDVAGPTTIGRITSSHREELTAFDLSANGSRLITAGHEGDVIVWDPVSSTPLHTFSVARSRRPGPLPRELPPPEVWAVLVALSPDGSRAAAVTIEGTVYAWDVMTGTETWSRSPTTRPGSPRSPPRWRAGRSSTPSRSGRRSRARDRPGRAGACRRRP